VDTFLASSFGSFVMVLFQGLFTAPSWQSFALLACGWALAPRQHTITTYLWLTGAATLKHFSRFYVFLGCPFYHARWRVWACIIRHAAQLTPAKAPLVIEFDDTTKKKAGRHIEGVACYRNGAGSARQEYRTLRGLNFVLGVMRVPLQLWPGHAVTVPIGLELYLKEEQARPHHRPYRSRSALAGAIVDFVAAQLPGRQIRVLGDGGYATKEFLRDLPGTVEVVSRFLLSGKLYALPEPPAGKRRGRPPRKGELLGSPKTLARRCRGWQPHPTEAKAEVQAWVGLWHTVLPGRLVRVVVIRRPAAPSRSLLHHGPVAQRRGHPAAVSRPLGRRNHDMGWQYLRWPGPGPVPQAPAHCRGQHVSPCDGRRADALVSRTGPASCDGSPTLSTLVPAEVRPQPTRHCLGLSRSPS
jgi:DDE superfamily endonuclease